MPAIASTSAAQSSLGFSRDCDAFLPSVNNGYGGDNDDCDNDVFTAGDDNDENNVGETTPPPRIVVSNEANEAVLTVNYKTPAIPKRVTKAIQQGKVSTPRVEAVAKACKPAPLNGKEQVQMDWTTDEEEGSDGGRLSHGGADTDNESLIGISPVKRVSGANFGSIASTSMLSPSSTMSAFSVRPAASTLWTQAQPFVKASASRFTVVRARQPRPALQQKPQKAKPVASATSSSSNGACRGAAKSNQSESHTNEAVVPPKNKEAVEEQEAEPVAGKKKEGSLLFDAELEEIKDGDKSNCDDDDEVYAGAAAPAAAVEAGAAEVAVAEPDDGDDLNVTTKEKPNAFDVLKKKSDEQRKSSRRRKTKTKKVVVAANKKTKQATLYEMVDGAKQLKSNNAKKGKANR